MTALLLGLLIGGAALLLSFTIVWARWKVRDRRRRDNRLRHRLRQRDDLERAARRLRLRIQNRPDGGGAPTLSPGRPLPGPAR